MALWLVRAGRHGEHEQRFLEEGRAYLSWSDLNHDLSKIEGRDGLRSLLEETYPDTAKNKAM